MRHVGQGKAASTQGVTILYSGKETHHTHEVGIIMSKRTSDALIGWKPVNERIILHVLTRGTRRSLLFKFTTEVASEDDETQFYDLLQEVLKGIPSYDIKIVIGDFNAKLSLDRSGNLITVGLHGSAEIINNNGERMVSFTYYCLVMPEFAWETRFSSIKESIR